MLQSIPVAAVILLNLIVIVYVVRERGRTRAGAFLLLNATALILWAGGLELWRSFNYRPHLLALAGVAPFLTAATLLDYVLLYPKPLVRVHRRGLARTALFSCVLVFAAGWNFVESSYIRQGSLFIYPRWDVMWAAEGGLPLVVLGGLLVTILAILIVQYNVADPGPDRNLPRHLILAVAAPSLFVVLFAVTTTSSHVTIIPSPSLLTALIAQMGILAVIRQEEVERPLYLSRWIFYSIMVLAGFFIAHMVYTLYESVTASVLLAPTVRWTILLTILVMLLAASIPPVQSFFDRLMFRRAWEYRQLVREAQAELYETRQRLRRAERLSVVGEMAARIAHEIKNPLGPIKGYTEIMRERLESMTEEEFPQRRAFLRQLSIIAEEVEAIDGKVRHLLDIARKPELTVSEEDINALVERAALLLRLEAETLNREHPMQQPLSIVEDLDASLPAVGCNRPRLEEALFNVCRNAFEAAGPGGTIALRTRQTAHGDGRPGIAIIVEDDGPGFTEAARQHLFEPFFTEKSDGTGLGLSIVKSHIDLHKGTIRFDRREGGGTTAVLWIPLEQAAVESAGPAPRPAPQQAVSPLPAESEAPRATASN